MVGARMISRLFMQVLFALVLAPTAAASGADSSTVRCGVGERLAEGGVCVNDEYEADEEDSVLLQRVAKVNATPTYLEPREAAPTVLAQTSAHLSAQATANISALVSANVSAQAAVNVSAQATANVSASDAAASLRASAVGETLESRRLAISVAAAAAAAAAVNESAAGVAEAQIPYAATQLDLERQEMATVSVLDKSGGGMAAWVCLALVAVVLGGIGLSYEMLSSAAAKEEPSSSVDADLPNPASRWGLVIASALVQIVAGSVYAMGAWQDELRNVLGVPMDTISEIGSVTFGGSLCAMLGGYAFDKLGPRASCILGGTMATLGYLLIGLSIVSVGLLPSGATLAITALGSLLAGFASVSLLDNVVCMACSLSFPGDRAAVVGYLKAVLATAAGLWALLWVHVFKPPNGPGLTSFLGFTAAMSLGVTIASLSGLQVLPEGPNRAKFVGADQKNLVIVVGLLCTLSFFNVGVSFSYARGIVGPTAILGMIGMVIAALPCCILLILQKPERAESSPDSNKAALTASAPAAAASDGLKFGQAAMGMDFWLLWYMQFAIFGGGVATNQNLAGIMESAGSPEAAGLGVALFALTSSLSRVAVGILSDKYSHVVSRFNWLVLVAAASLAGQIMMSTMSFGGIMVGTLLAGLAFGAFFTVIVPVVNEMYGRKQFGVIMGSQLASQAAAAFIISFTMMPTVYKKAAHGEAVCTGAACYRTSFAVLAVVSALSVGTSVVLERRNRESMPVNRM